MPSNPLSTQLNFGDFRIPNFIPAPIVDPETLAPVENAGFEEASENEDEDEKQGISIA